MDFVKAAWVPDDDPERDWSLAFALAAEWVDDRCHDESSSALLVTNALEDYGMPEMRAFESRHSRTSRRAGNARRVRGVGPVLSYVPDADDLAFAMGLARGSSIAVVESVAFPVSGWASSVGAVNLATGEPTPPLPDAVAQAVDRLKFYGNNGFGDTFGKSRAKAVLAELRATDDLDRDLLVSAVLGAGLSSRAAKALSRLVDKL